LTVEYAGGDKIRFLHLSSVEKGAEKGSKVYEGQFLVRQATQEGIKIKKENTLIIHLIFMLMELIVKENQLTLRVRIMESIQIRSSLKYMEVITLSFPHILAISQNQVM
jgi:hypothetical protein